MYENIKNAVDLAFTGKVNDMGQEIESALMQKVADVIAGKRVEVAQSLMTPVAENDEPVDGFEDEDLEENKRISESLTKGKKLISTHGEGSHIAKVYYDPDWEEHQVHYYRNGEHMGEGPVSYHSGNGRKEDRQEAKDSAEEGLRRLNKQKNESYVEENKKSMSGYLAWREPPSHSDLDDDKEPDFKGHMDDHPEYKRVAGYGKYKEFGVHKYTGKTLGAVPYIVSDDSGKDVNWTDSRKNAHVSAKSLASKKKYPAYPVKESLEEKLSGKQRKLDKNKNGRLDSQDFKMIRKESEELEEKLSVSDGVSAWIKDFIHSDNPRFEGKSKEERRKMAIGAFYAAKKG